MSTTKIDQPGFLVYSADPWHLNGGFKLWGIPQSRTLAEGLRYELIKNGKDAPERIHILPVDSNETIIEDEEINP